MAMSWGTSPALTSDPAYPATLIPGLFGPGRGYWLCPSHVYAWGTGPALTSGPAHPKTLIPGLFGPERGY